jgi:alcohol dehydrogenase (cytochrome c)
LWHAGIGPPMQSSPISYKLDGRQYIITSSGGVLFAWALPERGTIAQKPSTTNLK